VIIKYGNFKESRIGISKLKIFEDIPDWKIVMVFDNVHMYDHKMSSKRLWWWWW